MVSQINLEVIIQIQQIFQTFVNILELGRVVVESATLREESRGSHFRDDFNKSRDKFVGEFLFYKDEDGLQHKFIKKDNI